MQVEISRLDRGGYTSTAESVSSALNLDACYKPKVCYMQNVTTAWQRLERQQQWHMQKNQQTSHATTKQPTNNTKTCAPVI